MEPTPTMNEQVDDAPVMHLGFLVQCSGCQDIFTRSDFPSHICESLSTEETNEPTPGRKKPKEEVIPRHPCMSQLEENWARMRKFIKDELKVKFSDLSDSPGDPRTSSTECHICFRKLSSKPALAKHLAKHDMEPKEVTIKAPKRKGPLLEYEVCFVCLFCGRAFANVDQCEDHLWNSDSHQELKALKPDGVLKTRPLSAELVPEPESLTMDAVVLKFVFQCEYCDYVFARKEDLLKHEATHDPKLGYICTCCEINSSSSKEIQQHWQTQCPFVPGGGNQPKNINSLPAELAKIRLSTDFVCNVCFETFPSLDILYDHRHKENHYFPRYSQFDEVLLIGCEVCGDMFDNCSKYCEHFEELHTRKIKSAALSRNRQYLCHVCGKTYTQSSHLWQHLRFHQGVKPFKCTVEGCERRFTIRPDLNDHVRKFHTHERPYQCLVCGKRFLTGSVFYQHRLIHRGERRYECETCQKKFFRADALKNHNLIHTGVKPFKCAVCSKTFRQRGDCQKHMEVRHMTR